MRATRGEDPTKIDVIADPETQRIRGVTAHGNMRFDVPLVTQVEGNLWMGGCEDGLVLPRKIKHLVSLYPWERYSVLHELRSELYVRQYDEADDDPGPLDALAEWAARCALDAPTLVHCQAGLNRSARLTALVLVKRGFSPREAIALLREKRSPAVLCNKGFEKWLLEVGGSYA